jgi:hypothetical protein
VTAPLGSVAVSKLAAELHRMPAATRRALRRRLTALGQPLLSDARRRASWSSRIPAAMSVRPIADANRGRVGIQLRVNASQAPHARPYEGLSAQGSESYFRHPVFGDRETWVSQLTRPYAFPAVVSAGEKARGEVAAAAEDAAREAGFR